MKLQTSSHYCPNVNRIHSGAVSNRLPDHRRGTGHRRRTLLPPRLSQPRGATKPQSKSAWPSGAGRKAERSPARQAFGRRARAADGKRPVHEEGEYLNVTYHSRGRE